MSMIKKHWWIGFFLTSLGILLVGCSSPPLKKNKLDNWLQAHGKVRILCTIAMLEDIVCQVGGPHISCLTLIQGQLDPHTYELVKGDDEKLRAADLIFYNGLGLEHTPSLHHHLTSTPKAIGVGNQIQEQTSQEDPQAILIINGLPDPHIWMDISLWMRAVDVITNTLSEKDQEHASTYRANAKILLREMEKVHRDVFQILQSIPEEKRYLVTSHDAFNYFAKAYLADPQETTQQQWGKRCEAPSGLSPESQLSTLDIQRLVEHLERYRISVIFPESNVSQDSLRKIVSVGKERHLDITIAHAMLYGDALGEPGSSGDTYLKMIYHNAVTIAHYLDPSMQSK